MASEDEPTRAGERPIWLQPVADPGQEAGERGRGRWLAFLGAGLSLALFGALVWFLHDQGDRIGEPLLVKAPEGPVKVEPEDRGGLDVPHQDKFVFDRVSGEPESIEDRLREGPESPLERPDVPAIDAAATEPASLAGTSATPEMARPEGSAERADSASPSGNWQVQIAAFQQKRDADTWMIKTKYDHPDLFEGLSGEVVAARRDMATYYRVRFGPLADEAAARRLCAELKKVKINCLIVRPE
ncbi:MAG: hypothetical protein Kow00104_08640 [Rhodothalassiaceae bacterium]